MEDVLAVYQQPYDPLQPVVCLDEIHKNLRSTPRGTLAPQAGQPTREDYEYERHGTCALFLAVEPLRGMRYVWVCQQRTKLDCALVLHQLVTQCYPDAERIILVVDNLNIHHPACLYERFAPQEARRIAAKLEWHYTPEHGSWLNIAECELSVLRRQCLASRMPDREAVEHAANAWQTRGNQRRVIVDWQFTTQDARVKLKRLYPIFKLQNSA